MAVTQIEKPHFDFRRRAEAKARANNTPERSSRTLLPPWVYALLFTGAMGGVGVMIDAADGQIGEAGAPVISEATPNAHMSNLHLPAEPVPEAPVGR